MQEVSISTFNWKAILSLARFGRLPATSRIAIVQDSLPANIGLIPEGVRKSRPALVSSLAHCPADCDLLINLSSLKEGNIKDDLAAMFRRIGENGAGIAVIELDPSRPTDRETVTRRLMENTGHCFRIWGSRPDRTAYAYVTRRKPLALVFLGSSGSGKTASAIALAHAGLTLVHGDQLLCQIATGAVPCSERLRTLAGKGYDGNNWGLAIAAIFSARLQGELLACAPAFVNREQIIFDMWVPEQERLSFVRLFEARGYAVVACSPMGFRRGPPR